MSANPHANGGLLLRDLRLPDFRDYAVEVPEPGRGDAEATRVMGQFLRDVMKLNLDAQELPRLQPGRDRLEPLAGRVRGHQPRAGWPRLCPSDDHLAPDGRVMEILSEHQCQGWLEGYLLTGRHGFFSCYEAFIHIVDSMFNQHAKWLKSARAHPLAAADRLAELPADARTSGGRTTTASAIRIPGFIDHVVNKKAEVVRVYLPPDANTLLSVTDHCLRSRNYVNVIVAGKQPAPQWLDMDAGGQALHRRHRHLGVGQQRQRRRARRGDGLLRRRADAGDAGGRGAPAPALSRPEDPRRQRRRPDEAAAARPSIRTA